MKKILIFVLSFILCFSEAGAAVRGENTVIRNKNTPIKTTNKTSRSTVSRNAVKTTVSARSAKPTTILTKKDSPVSRTINTRNIATRTAVNNRTVNKNNVIARATEQKESSVETKTGEIYEQCKTAFFTCMDQFCTLKNDKFRRCSCSDKIYNYQEISDKYQKVSERLTEFSEDLDVVGMTKEQANAMKTASEGENALTEDKSASKQLLQAIMNAINGEKSSVGGKYESLNSVSIGTDLSNSFGMDDSGQIIASYNGSTLYKAIYPKCRNAVSEDCNNASLQRAVNAYLMAIEQDCNTVETALKTQQKTLKGATHQSSAMLDLARVENRQNRNSDDIATCLVNVEQAIQSEEVCGARYHKCLDYGQFIDVTTGAPLTGISDFYKLGTLLTFKNTDNIKDLKLSKISNNRDFINFFENKTKKFAKDALDKCSEQSDTVWQQYLDRALLDIYYAQQEKVKEIQDSCFSLVAACYENQKTSVNNAIANLTGDSSILLQPASISLTTTMCSDYIESCNNLFGDNVIQKYLANKDYTDSETACRAIAKQCFDKFGGTSYENLYNPSSGLFKSGYALDWFTLYDDNQNIVSPCAKEVFATEGCNTSDMLEKVFGGFDKTADNKYSTEENEDRIIRPSGVATEIYYNIINILSAQCDTLKGFFVEYTNAKQYGYNSDNLCTINTKSPASLFYIDYSQPTSLNYWYQFIDNEYMCPANYNLKVDIQSWGICSCWENGGYRSKNGSEQICAPLLRVYSSTENTSGDDPTCNNRFSDFFKTKYLTVRREPNSWCKQIVFSSYGQVCPTVDSTTDENTLTITCNFKTTDKNDYSKTLTEKVPHHKVSINNSNSDTN